VQANLLKTYSDYDDKRNLKIIITKAEFLYAIRLICLLLANQLLSSAFSALTDTRQARFTTDKF